ncbi:MAG: ATP-binding cassette domain-containing protein [Oscillospiraceae bacterium]|nr:ATP-binding cassette domain-containing protein [Oscillospiraceae bacterium]
METILTVNQIKKRYRKAYALNGISMHIPKGSIYGFVGRNGAGKTTMIRIICGLQEPTEGDYTLYGINSSDRGISRVRRRMGAVVERPAFYTDMTARQNLEMQYSILGLPTKDGIDELLRLVGLADTGSKKARNFSLGMKQRLGIAIALCGGPDFLVLDEPVNGLDPQGIVEIREMILKLNREKHITVLISSHILDELSKLATHYGFIEKGQIVEEISAEELEKKSRKYIRLRVSDTEKLARAAEHLETDYEIISGTEANIYTKLSVTKLTEALSAEGCELFSISEHEESLENYFINLIGGTKAQPETGDSK